MPGNWEAVQPTRAVPAASRSTAPEAESPRDAAVPTVEAFATETPRRTLAHLVVPAATSAELRAVLAKIQHAHTLYVDWDLGQIDPTGGRTALNLYGPPGTGKSLAAEALAHAMDCPLIRVSYAELESKYVGETPKNIRAAFRAAREADAVLFFDEADSILGRRLTQVTQSADHGVNVSRSVMLLELDRFSGTTIFATNLATNYDGAFVRRILAHVHMPLPDQACRERLWSLHMPERLPRAPDVEACTLAAGSEGLSGGDILNVVLSAASRAVDRHGDERRVTRADMEQAIDAVRATRMAVGHQATPRVTIEEVDVRDAPEDVRALLESHREDEVHISPDGFSMSNEQWGTVFAMLRRVAWADGDYCQLEQARIQSLARAWAVRGLPAVERVIATDGPGDDPDLSTLVTDPRAARFGLRECITLAFVDGHYHDRERLLLASWAEPIGVDKAEVEAMESWARQVMALIKLGRELVSHDA